MSNMGTHRFAPAELNYDEISVGMMASFRHTVTINDIALFAELSGDHNPLHMDDTYAGQSRFGRRVVHGMFLGALFSRLVGMHLPGRRCLYLSQSLDFLGPVHIGDEVVVSGEVQRKHDASRTLVLRTELTVLDQAAVRGKALVQVLE